jgi:type II secretory pathway pseudopilin PulG
MTKQDGWSLLELLLASVLFSIFISLLLPVIGQRLAMYQNTTRTLLDEYAALSQVHAFFYSNQDETH